MKKHVNLAIVLGKSMSIRDLNKELLRAVQKQDLDAVKRIIKLNDELSRNKAMNPVLNQNSKLLGLLKSIAKTKTDKKGTKQ